MFKKLCFLIFFVLVLALASSAYGDYIVGDFEKTLHYIREYQASMDQFSWSVNGATLHDYALRVDYVEGQNFWPFQFPLGDEEARDAGAEEFDPNIVANNTHIAYEVTWYYDDWPGKGYTWAKSEKITLMVEASNQEVGENDVILLNRFPGLPI